MVFLFSRKSFDTKKPHATGHRASDKTLRSNSRASFFFDTLKIIVLIPFLILIYIASIIVIYVAEKIKISH